MMQRTAEARGGLQKIRENIGVRASILLISGLAISSCSYDSSDQHSAQTYNEAYAVDDSATLDGNMCPQPNAQAMQKVKNLFTPKNMPEPIPYEPGAKIETIYDVAARHGLTLHNFNDSLVNLRFDAEIDNGDIPFNKYLDVMNNFTQKYGIEVVLGTEGQDITDPEEFALTAADYESSYFKQSFVAIADGLAEIPEEFIRKVGVKKIILAKIDHGTNTTENIIGYAMTDGSGTMYLDPRKGLYSDTIRHEIFHLWAAEFCGEIDMYIDHDYAAINPQDIYKLHRFDEKKGRPGKYVSRESVENQLSDLESDAYIAELQGRKKQQAELEKRIAALKALVIVDESYGLTEIAEDQATIGDNLLSSSSITALFDPEQPLLYSKAAFLSSRLYEFMPEMLEFYAEIGAVGSDGY